ncbi:recombinase family protein [Cetobacterium sp. SF1]|uniref:recombinase family protein n=1 Tax=Cetobacterium sp. SF1 TaxID=3417654 RepID=UPI003CF96274
MKEHGIEKLFIEKVSGKDMGSRAELQKMLEFAREGDTIYIHDFFRLVRSTKDLLFITEELKRKNVELVSFKENIRVENLFFFLKTGNLYILSGKLEKLQVFKLKRC